MNLFEIAWLEEEQVSRFRSDFRIVADYFVQKRKNQEYKPPETTICHVQEFLQLMSVMTGDNRFEEIYDDDQERRPSNMCEVLDRIEQRGKRQGERSVATLFSFLLANDRLSDLKRAANDEGYRHQLMKEILPDKETNE